MTDGAKLTLDQWRSQGSCASAGAGGNTAPTIYQEIVASIPVGLMVASTDLSILAGERSHAEDFWPSGRGDSSHRRLDAILPSTLLDSIEEVLKTEHAAARHPRVETSREKRLRVGILDIFAIGMKRRRKRRCFPLRIFTSLEAPAAPEPRPKAPLFRRFPRRTWWTNLDADRLGD